MKPPPHFVFPQDTNVSAADSKVRQGGMDLLDYFTGCALIGLLCSAPNPGDRYAAPRQALEIGRRTVQELEEYRKAGQ